MSARAAGTAEKPAPRAPVLALSVEEACQALGVSWDTWKEHIAADVRIVRLGRRKLIAVTELQRWLDEHGERALEGKPSSELGRMRIVGL